MVERRSELRSVLLAREEAGELPRLVEPLCCLLGVSEPWAAALVISSLGAGLIRALGASEPARRGPRNGTGARWDSSGFRLMESDSSKS